MVARPGPAVDRARPLAAGRGGGQRRVQRQDQLPPADPEEVAFETGVSGAVRVADGDQQPLVGDLGVRGVGETERGVQLGQPRRLDALRQNAEEVEPFLRRPGRRRQPGGPRFPGRPARRRGLDGVERRGRRPRRAGRQSGGAHPLLHRHGGGQRRVVEQMPGRVGQKVGGRDAPEREAVEVAAQERVEPLAAGRLLQPAEEQGALLVGHLRHPGVGVAAGEIDVQDLVGVVQPLEVGAQRPETEHRLHRRALRPVHRLDDAALQVDREALVQPEVAPGGVGHQVPGPRMGQLVGHQRDQAPVAGQDRRRREGQPGVLHAPEREAGRQHEQVVALPAVGAVQPLGRRQHRLGVGELVRRRLHHGRLGVDAGPRAERTEREVAGGQRDQVRRDRPRHVEAVVAVGRGVRIVGGAHHRPQPLRRADAGAVGHPHGRAVLQRDPAPRMDRLRLGEQEGTRAAGGLLRGQPLQARGLGARLVRHPDAGRRRREDHRERGAENRVGRGQRVRGGVEAAGGGPALHRGDRQLARVEHQRVRALPQAVEREHRRSAQPLLVEPDLQIELDVGDPDLSVVGVRVEIAARRIVRRRAGGGRPGITGHGGARQRQRERES